MDGKYNQYYIYRRKIATFVSTDNTKIQLTRSYVMATKEGKQNMFERHSDIAIHQVLNRFEKGDLTLLELIADDINLRIDHYKDDAGIDWQRCDNKEGFIKVLARLGTEIFPKGTTITGLKSETLGNGWYVTTFDQSFWYGLAEEAVESRTYIVSHELDGQLDYFRENVDTLQYKTVA